jgi:hypothetical protein
MALKCVSGAAQCEKSCASKGSFCRQQAAAAVAGGWWLPLKYSVLPQPESGLDSSVGTSTGHCAVLPCACAGTALVSVKPLTGPNTDTSASGPAGRRDLAAAAAAHWVAESCTLGLRHWARPRGLFYDCVTCSTWMWKGKPQSHIGKQVQTPPPHTHTKASSQGRRRAWSVLRNQQQLRAWQWTIPHCAEFQLRSMMAACHTYSSSAAMPCRLHVQ